MEKEKKGPCFELAVLATFPKPFPLKLIGVNVFSGWTVEAVLL